MENKSYDSQLVTNSKLCFKYNNNINTLALDDNGTVECIYNGKVVESFTFSKQGVNDKCMQLFQEGYKLIEIDADNSGAKEDMLKDTEQTKQELQKELDDVKEIKALKAEIDDNVEDILDESKLVEATDTAEDNTEADTDNADSDNTDIDNNTTESNQTECGIVILSRTAEGNYVPDVAVKHVNGDELVIADTPDDIMPLDKKSGSDIVKEVRKEMDGNTQWKIELWTIDTIVNTPEFWENAKKETDSEVSQEDVSEGEVEPETTTSNDLTEKDESLLKESFAEESTFPSTTYSEKVLNPEEIRNLEQCYRDNLTPEQIIWINGNIDDIEYVIEGFIGLLELIDLPDNIPFMSINDYLGELINEEVPNDENI